MSASAAPGQSSAGDGVVVIGASFAGLFAAAAAAKAGRHVTILERDRLPAERAPRSGVAQSEQPHVLLHRGLLAIESLLPGLREDLLDHGGVPFNTGRMPWLGEYG
jgi:2-polyprenyl-6-methoxyphenol hydroxylase-like FAD-dependent oxidoreductase